MNTIKKTTLIAAITAMAAFAVPAMASAAVWGPINTNKTLTSTSSAKFSTPALSPDYTSFECASSTLGVHVRTPASSTLDITSASFTGCVSKSTYCLGKPVTVITTGLPWAATTTGTNVTFSEHLQVTYGAAPCNTYTGVTVDGPVSGTYSNSTHTLGVNAVYPNFVMSYMGSPFAYVGTGPGAMTWHETTNTLNLT